MILKNYHNDLIPDCQDASDEVQYVQLLRNPEPMARCPNDQLPCFGGQPFCYPISFTCLYDLDINGELKFCRNGAHLTNCYNWLCQRSYKCPLSYCIPQRYVCDGVVDCPKGEDESSCKDPLSCPGMLKCRQGQCVHPSEVCDGIVHCAMADDERACLGECPRGCECYGRAISCEYSPTEDELPEFTYPMSYLSISGGYASSVTDFSKESSTFNLLKVLLASEISLSQMVSEKQYVEFPSLIKIDVSVNLITRLHTHSFSNMFHLQIIDVSRNRIGMVSEQSFKHINDLWYLNISMQNITSPMEIMDTAFSGLSNLNTFDIRNNGIVSLKTVWFESMSALRVLYLNGNPLLDVDPSMIGMFSSELAIHSDQPVMCCLSAAFTSCSTISNQTSGICARLLEHKWLNPMYFIIGGLVAFSNSFVLILRWNTRIDSLHKFSLFNMAVADFAHGLYMVTIASVDSYFGPIYQFSDTEWRAHPICKIIGFMSAVFIQMSVICSLIVARDRRRVICSGKLTTRDLWSKRKTLLSFIGIWSGTFIAIGAIFSLQF